MPTGRHGSGEFDFFLLTQYNEIINIHLNIWHSKNFPHLSNPRLKNDPSKTTFEPCSKKRDGTERRSTNTSKNTLIWISPFRFPNASPIFRPARRFFYSSPSQHST